MSNVYFISDLHIGHEKLIRNLRKEDPEYNWEKIKARWNNLVTKHDKVYICGDLTMDKPDFARRILSLNGDKTLIAGNHDTPRICKLMWELGIPVLASLEYKGFIVTHIPIHSSELNRFNGNIHGHLHIIGDESYGYNREVTNDPRYFNVNCEFNNYTPVLFNDIMEYYTTKKLIKANVKIRK